jgi:hypothetical protein
VDGANFNETRARFDETGLSRLIELGPAARR